MRSIEDMHSFSLMFLLKDTLNKPNTCLHLSKLHFKDSAIEKHGQDFEELVDLKKNGKASDNQVLKFKACVR